MSFTTPTEKPTPFSLATSKRLESFDEKGKLKMEADITSTYIWFGIFSLSGLLFWGTAVWALYRGFIDILDIVSQEKEKKKN